MPVCKICNTQNSDTDYLCKHCGSYLGFTKFHKFFLIGLIFFPCLFYAIYLGIKDYQKMQEIRQKNNVNIKDLLLKENKDKIKLDNIMAQALNNITTDLSEIDTFFVKNNMLKPRKKDGNIVKGDVKLCFNEDTFKIVQGDEIIENNVTSIYYLDIWDFKGDTYYKIVMRSHNEYTFKNLNDEVDEIDKYLRAGGIKVEDNRG